MNRLISILLLQALLAQSLYGSTCNQYVPEVINVEVFESINNNLKINEKDILNLLQDNKNNSFLKSCSEFDQSKNGKSVWNDHFFHTRVVGADLVKNYFSKKVSLVTSRLKELELENVSKLLPADDQDLFTQVLLLEDNIKENTRFTQNKDIQSILIDLPSITKVGIVDNGIDPNTEWLKSRIIDETTSNFNYGDSGEHGTHVAGVTSGNWPLGIGVLSRVKSYKTLSTNHPWFDRTPDKTFENHKAYMLAKDEVQVTNGSWGYNQFSDEDLKLFNQSIKSSNANGVINIMAAGNSGDVTVSHKYDDSILKVSSLTKTGDRNYFSQVGDRISYAGYGDEIWSATTGKTSKEENFIEKNQQGLPAALTKMSGTSMASPVVTGVVANLFSVDPTLSQLEIKKILSASSFKTPEGDDRIEGEGVVNAYKALLFAEEIKRAKNSGDYDSQNIQKYLSSDELKSESFDSYNLATEKLREGFLSGNCKLLEEALSLLRKSYFLNDQEPLFKRDLAFFMEQIGLSYDAVNIYSGLNDKDFYLNSPYTDKFELASLLKSDNPQHKAAYYKVKVRHASNPKEVSSVIQKSLEDSNVPRFFLENIDKENLHFDFQSHQDLKETNKLVPYLSLDKINQIYNQLQGVESLPLPMKNYFLRKWEKRLGESLSLFNVDDWIKSLKSDPKEIEAFFDSIKESSGYKSYFIEEILLKLNKKQLEDLLSLVEKDKEKLVILYEALSSERNSSERLSQSSGEADTEEEKKIKEFEKVVLRLLNRNKINANDKFFVATRDSYYGKTSGIDDNLVELWVKTSFKGANSYLDLQKKINESSPEEIVQPASLSVHIFNKRDDKSMKEDFASHVNLTTDFMKDVVSDPSWEWRDKRKACNFHFQSKSRGTVLEGLNLFQILSMMCPLYTDEKYISELKESENWFSEKCFSKGTIERHCNLTSFDDVYSCKELSNKEISAVLKNGKTGYNFLNQYMHCRHKEKRKSGEEFDPLYMEKKLVKTSEGLDYLLSRKYPDNIFYNLRDVNSIKWLYENMPPENSPLRQKYLKLIQTNYFADFYYIPAMLDSRIKKGEMSKDELRNYYDNFTDWALDELERRVLLSKEEFPYLELNNHKLLNITQSKPELSGLFNMVAVLDNRKLQKRIESKPNIYLKDINQNNYFAFKNVLVSGTLDTFFDSSKEKVAPRIKQYLNNQYPGLDSINSDNIQEWDDLIKEVYEAKRIEGARLAKSLAENGKRGGDKFAESFEWKRDRAYENKPRHVWFSSHDEIQGASEEVSKGYNNFIGERLIAINSNEEFEKIAPFVHQKILKREPRFGVSDTFSPLNSARENGEYFKKLKEKFPLFKLMAFYEDPYGVKQEEIKFQEITSEQMNYFYSIPTDDENARKKKVFFRSLYENLEYLKPDIQEKFKEQYFKSYKTSLWK